MMSSIGHTHFNENILSDVSNLQRDQAEGEKLHPSFRSSDMNLKDVRAKPCILGTDKEGNAIVKIPPTIASESSDIEDGSDVTYTSESSVSRELANGDTASSDAMESDEQLRCTETARTKQSVPISKCATSSESSISRKLKKTASAIFPKVRTLDNWLYFFKGDKRRSGGVAENKPSLASGGIVKKDEDVAISSEVEVGMPIETNKPEVSESSEKSIGMEKFRTKNVSPRMCRRKTSWKTVNSGTKNTSQKNEQTDAAINSNKSDDNDNYEVEDIVDERVKQMPKKGKQSAKTKRLKRKARALQDRLAANLVGDVTPSTNTTLPKGRTYFFVKWKGWSSDDNTWEPAENLNNCESVLKRYHRKRKLSLLEEEKEAKRLKLEKQEARENERRALQEAKEKERQLLRDKILKKVTQKISEEELLSGFQKLQLNPKAMDVNTSELNKALTTLMKDGQPNKDSKKALEVVKTWVIKTKVQEKRREQKKRLKEAQDALNAICTGTDLFIENEVDFEDFPDCYKFINDYQAGKGITIPDDPIVGCNCPKGDCLANKDNCCADGQAVVYAYTPKKKLRLTLGTPIIECNRRCPCPATCPNRVVQHGRTVKLCIFRTPDGRGWGVKSRENIPKDTFITEYVGEVISTKEAERRGKQYDAAGRTYLFDLDFDSDANLYTVDATKFGNEARFFNHSCTPNMDVFCVYINCLDLNLPRIALFSKRAVKKGEELTFDYCGKARKD